MSLLMVLHNFGSLSNESLVLDGCSIVSYNWVGGWDWVGSPGGVRYRAAYTANNLFLRMTASNQITLWPLGDTCNMLSFSSSSV